jgi:MarR family transcriptional regulator, teicoplanin-associated locus regulator
VFEKLSALIVGSCYFCHTASMDMALFGRLADFQAAMHQLEYEISKDAPLGVVTPLQYRLLQIMHFSAPKTLGQLAECATISLPNASREVRKLATLALVEKHSVPENRRLVQLSLSPKGVALVNQVCQHQADSLAPRLAGISPEQQAALLGAITSIEQILLNKP